MNKTTSDNEESIISSAPNLQSKTSTSIIPKPFARLTHLKDPLIYISRNESPKSPALVSPHNRAWLDSPDSFIGRIPESHVMSGCVAFVDVWSTEGNDNRSIVFSKILSRMGATISKRFTLYEKITHLVFKDGHKSYLQKAKKRDVKIVNCLWVDKCRQTQMWVNEEPYLFDDTNYKPPKKFREMQPLDPEVEMERRMERHRRRLAREEKKNTKKAVGFLSPLVTCHEKDGSDSGSSKKRNTLACDTPYRSLSHNFYHPRLVSETPSESILRKLQRMKEGKPIFSPPSSPLSDSSQASDVSLPQTTPENLKEKSVASNMGANVLPPSQSSDMNLTCGDCDDQKLAEVSVVASENVVNDNLKRNSGASFSEDSLGFHLHISDSSNCFSDDSLPLLMNQSKGLPPKQKEVSHANLPLPALPKPLPKRARRKLCEEDILKPASYLVSPKPGNNIIGKPGSNNTGKPGNKNIGQQVVSRRSRRLSSIAASQAISLLCNPKSSQNSSKLSISSRDSCSSLLPPPGQSAVKAAAGRRYFEPIRVSASSCGDSDDDENSDENFPRKRRRSQSTAYEEENAINDDEKISSKDSVLSLSQNSELNPSTSPKLRKIDSNNQKSQTRKRKSPRKTKRRQKVVDKENNDKLPIIIQELIDAPKPRRSTDEFNTAPLCGTTISQTHKYRTKGKKHSVLVLTSLHSDERVAMEKIVRHLGRFRVRASVKDEQTSHVVCGAARRTLNVLHAIVKGLWLLSKDWLLDSMRAGKWLKEEDYEVDFFPSAKQVRKLRNRNPDWTLPLFRPVKGHVYVSPDTEPPSDELRELVTQCGGHVIHSPRRACIRVGRWVTIQHSLPAVKETWILENTLKPTQDYWIS